MLRARSLPPLRTLTGQARLCGSSSPAVLTSRAIAIDVVLLLLLLLLLLQCLLRLLCC